VLHHVMYTKYGSSERGSLKAPAVMFGRQLHGEFIAIHSRMIARKSPCCSNMDCLQCP
jgi:hypothetical protein